METINRDLGYSIANVRANHNIKQAELAKLIGISKSSLSKIENGRKNILVSELIRIANALCVPYEEILKNVV